MDSRFPTLFSSPWQTFTWLYTLLGITLSTFIISTEVQFGLVVGAFLLGGFLLNNHLRRMEWYRDSRPTEKAVEDAKMSLKNFLQVDPTNELANTQALDRLSPDQQAARFTLKRAAQPAPTQWFNMGAILLMLAFFGPGLLGAAQQSIRESHLQAQAADQSATDTASSASTSLR